MPESLSDLKSHSYCQPLEHLPNLHNRLHNVFHPYTSTHPLTAHTIYTNAHCKLVLIIWDFSILGSYCFFPVFTDVQLLSQITKLHFYVLCIASQSD